MKGCNLQLAYFGIVPFRSYWNPQEDSSSFSPSLSVRELKVIAKQTEVANSCGGPKSKAMGYLLSRPSKIT